MLTYLPCQLSLAISVRSVAMDGSKMSMELEPGGCRLIKNPYFLGMIGTTAGMILSLFYGIGTNVDFYSIRIIQDLLVAGMLGTSMLFLNRVLVARANRHHRTDKTLVN